MILSTQFEAVPVTSFEVFESPVGPLIAATNGAAICRLGFCEPDGMQERVSRFQNEHPGAARGADALLERLRVQLAEYFDGRRREFDTPLACAGTPFQRRVWSMLMQIPYGATWSYLDVARRIDDPGATRAVGAANGANPLAIIVPCHRVVNANGSLGGYGGGAWRKRTLLDLELGQGTLAF